MSQRAVTAGPVTFVAAGSGSTWRYLDSGVDQGKAWRQLWFNDSAWKAGPAPLGYGDGDEATVVGFGPSASSKFITTYFRRTFTVADPSAVSALALRLVRDDGAVVYVNGVEVARSNMPLGQVGAQTTALSPGLDGTDESTFQTFSVSPRVLVTGTNVIAVEVHQQRADSSDLSFDLELKGTVNDSPAPTALVASASTWRVLDTNTQPASWAAPSFNDGAWAQKQAQLGYGDGDERSAVGFGSDANKKFVTTYFRKRFSVASPASFLALTLRILRDDGAIAYLNGQEVYRRGMPDGVPTKDTLATATVAPESEGLWDEVVLPIGGLVAGENVLAVEVHQVKPDSSDLSFDAELLGTVAPPPAAPTGLVLSSGVPSQVGLAWRDNSSNETGFKIERSTDGTSFNPIATVGAGVTGYTDTGRAGGTTYHYRVRATNGAGDSAPTATVSLAPPTTAPPAPPAPPSGMTAIVSVGASWRYSDAGRDLGTAWRAATFSDVDWSTGAARLGYGGDGEATTVAFGSNPASRRITTYYRKVFSVDKTKVSQLKLFLQNDDGAVVYLNGTEVARDNVAANQTASTPATTALSGADELAWKSYSPAASLLSATGSNVLAVEVHQATADSSDLGFDLALYGNLPPLATPTAPSDLQVTSGFNTQVGLAWRDNSSNESGFRIERSTSATSGFAQIAELGPNVTGYTDRGRTGGTTYFYRVRASNAAGASAYTAVGSVAVPTAAPPAQPGAPAGATTLVAKKSTWRYNDSGNDLTGFHAPGFSDATWKSGAARLGFGGDGEATTITFGPNALKKFVTTYFRTAFSVANRAAYSSLVLRILRDDGAVIYLNGKEIARSNMPAGGVGPQTLASSVVLDNHPDEQKFFELPSIPASALVNGTNVLAVEVHQGELSSSDLAFDLELFATPASTTVPFAPTTLKTSSGVPSQVGLAWKDEATNETGYKIERSTSATTGFTQIATVGANVTGYTDRGLTGGTTYHYRVRASGGAGDSPYSAVASQKTATASPPAPPAAPTGATAFVTRGSTWKYLDDGSDQGSSWRAAGFNDGAWRSGPARIGFGGDGEATTAAFGPDPDKKHITTYFRKTFSVANLGAHAGLVLRLLRDDGAIVYLNGTKIVESNAPAAPVGHKSTVVEIVDDLTKEQTYKEFTLPRTALVAGTNTLAVEVHQWGPGTSDLGFDLELFGTPTAPPQASPVVRGPYLQLGTTTSATVRWRTSTAQIGRVRYGTSLGALTSTKDDGAATTDHEIKLTNLAANTKYYYSVGTPAEAQKGGDESYFFTTAPSAGKPTRVWVLGDSGKANAAAAAVRDAYKRFAGARPADLMLMLGDNAYESGTDSDYQKAVFDMYPEILRQTFLWPTIGNHDSAESSDPAKAAPYRSIFTLPTGAEAGGVASGSEHYYSFNYGDVHFVCLDSMVSDRSASAPMLTWLKNDLAANTKKWTIAYWHHPPYSKGSHNSDTEANLVDMRQNALPILEANGVDLVLSGHSHSYERSFLLDGHYGASTTLTAALKKNAGSGRIDQTGGAYTKATAGKAARQGAVYVVAGNGSQATGGALDHPAMFISLNQLGSFVVDVDGDRLDARMIRENASVADYFTIVKGTTTSPPPPATSVSCAGRAAGSACGDGNVCDGNGKCVASLTPIPNGITQYEPQIPPKATSTGGGGGPGGGGNGPEGFPLTGDLSSPAWVCADGNTHLQWKAGPTVKSSTGTDVPLNDVQYASSPNPACVFNVCEDRDGALEMPVTRPTLEELRSATYPASDGNGCDKSDGPGLCPIETYTDKVCRPGDPTDRSCDPTKQEICALKCDGVDCTKSQHVCAVRATSCGEGLPQLGTFFDPDINRNSECRDIRQCADPGSVAFTDGATDENDMENEAALRVEQTNEQAEAQVREQFARPAPAPNDPYDYGQECTLDNGQEVAPTNTTPVAEGAQGNRSMEKPKWKINFSPGFLQKVELKPFPLGFAEPRLKVKSDWGAGAYILGDRIEIIGVHGQAEASLCGAQYQAYAVLLTQKIDITGNGIEPQGTPSATIAECRAKLDGLVAKANELKKALSDAVKVRRSFLERKVDQANQLVDETWSTIVLPSHEFFIRIGELAELTDPANAYTKYRAYAESWARELIGEARFQAIQKEQELIADAQERATAVFRSALWEAFAVRDEVAGRARALTDSANNAIALTEHAVNAVIENYENKANEFFNNQAAEVKSYIRETVAGGTTFEDRVQLFDRPRQFTLVAVKQPFALGPIPGVIEVESGGQWGVPGGLFYKVKAVATSEVSDNLLDRAGASAGFYGTPMVSAHARVYVAAGIANRFGDVRFGVNGQLHLVTFTSKLEGSLHLRQGKPKADPRTTIDSSYLASKTSGFTGKGAFHAGWDSFPWELSWGFNAGGKLSLLSGEIDIMARVRIAFFKKTFKRRLAHWKGKTLPEFTWNKVGKFDSGDVGIAIPNPLSFNFKAQVKFPRMSLPRIPNISEYIKSLGEDLELGSSQGGEVHQGLSLGYKGICVPKAPGQTVCGNGKVYDDYFQECRCPYGTLESATLNKCATCAEIAQAEGTGKPLFSTFEVDSDKRCISVKECEDHFLTSEGKIQRLGNECVRRGL